MRSVFCILIAGLILPFAWAEQLEPIPAREAVGLFRLAPGIRIELIAAEPEVVDPVAMCFDEAGRLYVVENRGYPTQDESNPVGSVTLLEDTDEDGYFETRSVFADKLTFPNGVMPWKGGIIVTCAPDVLFFKDTDGDKKADVKDSMLSGFSLGGSTQLRVSHPTLNIDNWIYVTNGLSGGEVTSPDYPEIGPITMGSYDFRFFPLTGSFETTAGQAQFGQAFDDYGRKFFCSNRRHIAHVVMQPHWLSRNPDLGFTKTYCDIPDHGAAAKIFALSEARTTAYAHAGTFTAACGLTIFRGTALPEEYRGNSFVCEPTANLVHTDRLVRNGGTFVAERVRDGVEFLATTDNWSRPVFLCNGPDGALYLCDMYRKTIEHPTYLPPEVAAVTDFDSGKQYGRIYRIVTENARSAGEALVDARLDDTNVEALCEALRQPNGWTRDTAHRLLIEKEDPATAGPLHRLLANETIPQAKAHAMHLLQAFQELTDEEMIGGMQDPSPDLRETAVHLAWSRVLGSQEVVDQLIALADDPAANVRFATALALGDSEDPRVPNALATVAAKGIDDEWTRAAALSSAGGDMPAFAEAFLAIMPRDARSLPDMLSTLGRTFALGQEATATGEFVSALLIASAAVPAPSWQMAGAMGVLEGIHQGKQFDTGVSALARLKSSQTLDDASVDHFDSMVQSAIDSARDGDASLADRLAAVQMLGYTDYDTAADSLGALLTPHESQELQVGAVQALGTIQDDRIGPFLVDAETWRPLTKPSRTAILGAMLTTKERILTLMDAIDADAIEAWAIDPATRNRLQHSNDEAIKQRAEAAFAEVKTTDRAQVYEEFKSALALAPHPAEGHGVFRELCSPCHTFKDEGFAVGPDLTDIRSQPIESILLHIIMPNSLLVEGYENYVVETVDFQTYSGIITSQTESTITIRGPLGVEDTVQRDAIENMYTASLSLMPEELEKAMTKQQLRDLIGYLKGEQTGE